MNIYNANLKYKEPLISLNLNKVFFIVIHHTDAESSPPEQVHKWHIENGWSGNGYNEMIMKNGDVYICRGDNIGAQTANMNSKSYGIACEGNYDFQSVMPDAQFKSLIERIKYNKDRFPNLIEVAPHNKFTSTSCPGKFFPLNKMYQELNTVSIQASIDTLVSKGIIGTPKYWINNAQIGCKCDGGNVDLLIRNMARYIQKG